jgi:transcription elongation factor Elf1
MSEEQSQEQNQQPDQQQEQSETTGKQWSPPKPREVTKAITTALNKRKKKITRTIICKLHKPSRRKAGALLWAQAQVTNMTAHILEALRETPGEERDDKALAFIQEMYSRKAQGHPSNLTILLADILADAFGEPERKRQRAQQDDEKPPITIWEPPYVPAIRAADYPVTAHLRTGAYRETAKILITWYKRIIKVEDRNTEEIADDQEADTTKMAPEQQDALATDVPDIAAVHAHWAAKRMPYEAAAQTMVPFGWYRGKTLEQVGKREVRWLRERLIPEKVAQETLEHIEVLLNESAYQEETDRIRQARQARHPWRRQTGLQRKTKVSRAFDRSLDVREPLIRLTTLNEEELLNLQSELNEMVEFASQFEAIRQAIDIFLQPAPASYPTVQALLSGSALQEKREAYDTAIEALRIEVFEADQEGADEALQTFQTVASELGRPALQPLAFKRPMQPERRAKKVAQVLAEGELYEFVLAVVVHGQEAFRPDNTTEQPYATEPASAEAVEGISEEQRIATLPQERFEPVIHPEPVLYYVNYPHTPFTQPKGTSLLLFPLEFGEEYQEHTFLRQIIERQRGRQAKEFAEWPEKQRKKEAKRAAQKADGAAARKKEKKPPQSVADCFPQNAPIGSARIVSRRNRQGHREFYIHLPIEDETEQERRRPQRIIGFHEHAYGYSYAILDFKGTVQQVGDVAVPPHALPKEGDRSYSDNYAFETVKAMIDLTRREDSRVPNMIIGLERGTWRKQRVTLSREQNRQQFARPSAKIATILTYKAFQVGLVRLHEVNVSPHRCSNCDAKRDQSTKNIYSRTTHCATCGSDKLQEMEADSGELTCQACGSTWQEYEPWFTCPSCKHHQMARLNTAIVVARYALTGFVAYWNKARQNIEQDATRKD